MEQPLISVIIPAYNIESCIARTLDSVLAQTYQNLEIIVVNDGSKDGTGRVIDEYANQDSRVLAIHKGNGGVTSARLCGVEAASGQWVGFVDGDDYVEPDMYQLLIDNALRYGADISHCGYQMVFPSRRVPYHGTKALLKHNRIQGLSALLSGELVEPGLVTKLYRRELLMKLVQENVLDQSIKINEDLLMNFYLFSYAEKSVFQDDCKYHYIVRANSAANSRLNSNQLYDPLKVSKIILERTQNVPQLHRIILKQRLHQLISRATADCRKDPQLLKPSRKQAHQEIRQMIHTGEIRVCGKKAVIMANWVALWPASYGFVHRIYAKVTGLDKIYEIK